MIFLDTTEARVRMVRRGLSVQSIATRMGVSRASVSRWIHAVRPLPPSRKAAFLEHLGPARGLFLRADPKDGAR